MDNKNSMYSIKDVVSGRFGEPFLCYNDDVAKRTFKNFADSSPFKADLQLYKIGIFDIILGKVTEEFAFICNAISEVVENE